MFAHFTKIIRKNNDVEALIGRFEEQSDEFIYFDYGIYYWLYFDIRRKEVVRSKINITHTHNELLKLMVVKFNKNNQDYLIEDYRGKKEWV